MFMRNTIQSYKYDTENQSMTLLNCFGETRVQLVVEQAESSRRTSVHCADGPGTAARTWNAAPVQFDCMGVTCQAVPS